MKLLLIILFLSNFLFSNAFAQEGENLVFKYRCVPTSTTDYSIEISRYKFTLKRTEKTPNNNRRIIKVDSSTYTHSFDPKEKEILDSIIKLNKLDSVGLYQDRVTEWGSLWEVKIQRNAITYNISLPNYNNVGLESLIHFIVCLIPRKELPPFECIECDAGK